VRDDADWCAERNSFISDDAIIRERRKQSQTCQKTRMPAASRQPRQRSRA
jgi:hypothetical protein